MKKATTIFKFQRSQFSVGLLGTVVPGDQYSYVLMYNQRRTVFIERVMPDDYKSLFEEHGEKFYAEGTYDPESRYVEISQVVEPQSW